MKHIAIVLAAGSGKRMGSDCPKQFIEIDGKPILYYCLKTFDESFMDEIIVVTRESDIEYVSKEIVKKYSINKVTEVIAGGSERYDSVYNGLCHIEDTDSLVYIHDGARAFVSDEVLNRTKEALKEHKACVVCVPSKDTIKVSDADLNVSDTPDRATLWCAQTPQAFSYDVIMSAFTKMYKESDGTKGVTDDASVVEKFSDVKVKIVEGEYTNIKITTPEDLALGKMILGLN